MNRIWLLIAFLSGCVTPPVQPVARALASESVFSQFAGLSSVVSVSSGTTRDLKTVAGFDQEVWALGENLILKHNSSAWTAVQVPLCPKHDYQNLAVMNEDDVHITCTLENGKTGNVKWNGKVWSDSDTRLIKRDEKKWGGWSLGDKGTVAHVDGALLETRTLSSSALNSIYGVKIGSFENIWVVGNNGVILFFDGVLWQDIASGTKENLSSVWIDASGTAWIVGAKGLILHSTD